MLNPASLGQIRWKNVTCMGLIVADICTLIYVTSNMPHIAALHATVFFNSTNFEDELQPLLLANNNICMDETAIFHFMNLLLLLKRLQEVHIEADLGMGPAIIHKQRRLRRAE